jgi:hypothetical protein
MALFCGTMGFSGMQGMLLEVLFVFVGVCREGFHVALFQHEAKLVMPS